MNTPAHAVLNLCLLERMPGGPRVRAWTLAGALAPDLPMFAFYAWVRLVDGLPEAEIWSETYYRADWQLFFDLFNSIPLALAGLWIARQGGHVGLQALFASVILHGVSDLAVHHDDGHRHFLPLSDFRFESPISYWDPAHHGLLVARLELLMVGAGCLWLWPRIGRGGRVALALTLASYLLAHAALLPI